MKMHRAGKVVWIGRILSVLICVPFMMSAWMKLSLHPEVIKGMQHTGIPESLILPLGILELACVLIYLVPMTSTLGSILLTGYLGGAILTHLRIGEPAYLQFLFGVIIWLGLYLREPLLRKILPLRCRNCSSNELK